MVDEDIISEYISYIIMVRNTQGGCKAKSHARKFSSNYTSKSATRLSSCALEVYACVTKLFGQGRCLVHTVDDKELQCIIRNKFRGRSKRNNVVAVGTLLLIGLREWKGPDFHTCDVLEVYDQEDVNQLRAMPCTRVMVLDKFSEGVGGSGLGSGLGGDLLVFGDCLDAGCSVGTQKVPSEECGVDAEEEVDIDDI